MTKASTFASSPIACSDLIANTIDSIGTEDFFPKFAELIEKNIFFDGLFICLYSENSAPTSLGCFNAAREFQVGMENYLKYSYVINPVYRAFQNGVTDGAYLMSDLMTAGIKGRIAQSDIHVWIDDQETIGYRTPGWPKNMAEVLGLIWLPDNRMVELCLLNPMESRRILQCHADLKAILPILSSALLKHFAYAAQDFDTSTENPNLELYADDFGKSVLTDREQCVAQMILKGNSSNAISLTLGISLPTVKTHRRNIYAKYQISSQAELFYLFMQEMMEVRP